MDLNDFAINFPELYLMIDEDVRYALTAYQITGDESLRDWDSLVDNLVQKYDQPESYEYDMDPIMAQQFDGDFRDRDRRRDDRFRRRPCRNCRDFNVRDVTRLLFLRRLFDRDRR